MVGPGTSFQHREPAIATSEPRNSESREQDLHSESQNHHCGAAAGRGAMRAGAVLDVATLPFLLTPDEAAGLLRTTRKAIYARAERGLLPGAFRDGRRLLVRRDELLRSLSEKRTASPGGSRR
jgi:excisionase family DNA binding protein